MKSIAIIPARMNSSRFPGKPMAKINGIPMVEVVYKNVQKCKMLDEVFVATCDHIIYEHILKIGGKAIMTSNKHNRCTSRCAEALKKIEKKYKVKIEIISMVQGDEPMINSKMINQSIKPLINDKSKNIINLLGKIDDKREFMSKNSIKVAYDRNLKALYFSREPIPHNIRMHEKYYGKQVCVISFRRKYLLKYQSLKSTDYEKTESIDMLRFLENDIDIHFARTNETSYAVDTLQDLKKVEKIIKK